MNDQELDLENINEIDMECNVADDDDDFGIITTKNNNPQTAPTEYVPDPESEARPLQSQTGVIIDLSDDEDARPMKTITADFTEEGNLNISKNYNSEAPLMDDDYHDYNEIDMETKFADDTDDEEFGSYYDKPAKDVDDDYIDDTLEDEDDLAGLIDEEMLEEKRKKKKVTQGEVEADYWKKIQKKHAASNKKGAYNSYLHLAGDPKLERELFNHDVNPNNTSNAWAKPHAMDGGSFPVSLTGSGEGEAAASASASGEGGGCSESFTTTENPYKNKFERFMDLIGFDIFKNSDNTYSAFDRCEPDNDLENASIDDVMVHITPYIETCIIYPLECMTDQKFDNQQGWIDWYKDNGKNYPEYAEDIDCLDLINNHLEECFK